MGRTESGSMSNASRLGHEKSRKSVSGVNVIRLVFLPYLDPGSGSFLIQILIAAVLGGVVSAGLWFRRILGIFRRSSDERPNAGSLEIPEPTEADRGTGDGPDGAGQR